MAETSFPINLRIPFPPSVNRLFINRRAGGRARSESYDAWISTARRFVLAYKADYQEAMQQPFEPITEMVKVMYFYGEFDDGVRRDIENFAKAVSDLLVKEGILKDDSQIRRMELEWADWIESGYCDVYVENYLKGRA